MADKAYLFTYFTGEDTDMGEQIYFATSLDGLHWRDLNGNKAVITSNIGKKGLRDAFILRCGSEFIILATDLKIFGGTSWHNAVHGGSTKIAVMRSQDLISWSRPALIETGVEGAGCAWAPEAIFDRDKGEYLVYWASFTEKEGKHVVYAAYTKDFISLGTPFVFCRRQSDVIDTAVLLHKDTYYRISKNETEKTLLLEKSKSLNPESFQRINSRFLDNLYGVEGPCGFVLPNGDWCIMADRFLEHKGYLPISCRNLESGEMTAFSENEFDLGTARKRHGSVIEITMKEYKALQNKYGKEEKK